MRAQRALCCGVGVPSFFKDKVKGFEMRQRKNKYQNCKVNIFIELKLV